MACAEVILFRSYISAFMNAGLRCLPLGALQCGASKNFGVASVILQPTKTAISLAAMSSLQGTILTPNILNLTLLQSQNLPTHNLTL